MAGRPGITLVDVVRACVALKQQGRRLGPSNVRLELGRGSMTTISRHLQRLALRDASRELRG
ncbi:DNA-binding protein [Ralstonia solanacearum]|nr:DNA-binding protein [Ralstonia solanacearum]QKL65531.1 DNA-binding protein [Ralstonia solanacearum]